MDRATIDRAYRRLFLTDDGALTTDGEIVLRDLEAKCGWMVEAMPIDKNGAVNPLRIAGIHDRRTVYSHIRRRLFEDITKLKRAKEEMAHE